MSHPALIVFDLDGTLIDADCAQDWLSFLKAKGWPGAAEAESHCATIMKNYDSGQMDMQAYMAHWVLPIEGRPVDKVDALAEEFAFKTVNAQVFIEGLTHIADYRKRGDIIILISASPTLVVTPIARLLGIDNVIGIDVAVEDHCYASDALPPFSFGPGKLLRLQQWLRERQLTHLPLAMMYSDSCNDLPLLYHARQAFVVNADPVVTEVARRQNWQILHWKTA